jgi:hypothetical protein
MTYAFLKPRGVIDPVLGLGQLEAQRAEAEQVRSEARSILGQYTDQLDMDPDDAARAMRKAEAWANDNGEKLKSLNAQNPNEEVPQNLALVMRQEDAQDMFRAFYALPARGLGPIISGYASQSVADGTFSATEGQVAEDTSMFTDALSSFREFDKPGKSGKSLLGEVFDPKPKTLNGLGYAQVSLVVIAIIAVVGLMVLVYKLITHNRELKTKAAAYQQLCVKAQSEGDDKTLEKCMEGMKPPSTQEESKIWAEQLKWVGVGAVIVAGLYLYAITPKRALRCPTHF